MLFAGGAYNASFFQRNVPVKLSTVPEVNGTRQVDDRTQVRTDQKRELTLALTPAGRRLLRRSGRLRTRLRVAVTSPTGHRSSARQQLTFRARG